MKFVKWVILTLCLVCLTACGELPEQPYTPPQTAAMQEEAVPETQPLQAQFTVMADGSLLEPCGIYFGGEMFVDWAVISQALKLTEPPAVSVQKDGRSFVRLEDVEKACGGVMLRDEKNAHVYFITEPGPWQIPEGYRVPVLMYHGVSDDMWGMTELFVSPSAMEKQIRYLVENGYTPIWFEDLPHVDEIEKPVILTYDDGYTDNYHELFPILKKYNVKATVFMVTGTADYNPNSLTSAQIKEMSDSGLVSIQSHTVTHPYLRGQTAQQQEYELVQSFLDLAHITGKMPTVICYPSGSYDETTLELARKYYRMGIDMNGQDYVTGEDPYEVQRFYIRRQDTLGTFISYIQ